MNRVTDVSFEADVLRVSGLVLVDFWSATCGRFRQIAPLLENISKEAASRVKIVDFDITENRLTPTKYGVVGIPTLILFKDGQVAARKLGAVPQDAMMSWPESVVV